MASQVGGPSNNLAVLLIDDDPTVRLASRRALDDVGFTVVEAGDGVEGLERLEAMPVGPDVVVSDVRMPDLSGLDVANAIALCRPTLPVLLISGYAVELLDDRRVRLLPKPFLPAQLIDAIRDEVERARHLRENAEERRDLFLRVERQWAALLETSGEVRERSRSMVEVARVFRDARLGHRGHPPL